MNKIFLFLIVAIIYSCSPKSQEKIKPNILWLTFEDTSPQYIGCYGNRWAKTPTMDALAKEGVLFNSAFSTGTACSPSRYTLITGCRTTSYGTGHHRSSYGIPDHIEPFPELLREAGYYTSNNSKTDYNTSKAQSFIKSAWDESSAQAGWWNRKPGQPFFAVFNSIHSHQSRTMTNPWWKYEEQILDSLEKNSIIMDSDFEMPPIYKDTPEMRKEHARVYNAIQLTDIHFGRILERLNAEALRDSTIIFCFSDHGQGISWGKCHPRAMGYRVPFIIWFPDMYKHLSPWGTNVVTSDVIDFADLPATVLSLVGIDIPEYMEGVPLLGSNSGEPKKYTIGGLDRSGENLALSRSISDGEYIFNKNFMPFQSEMRWQKYFDYGESAQLIRKDFEEGNLNAIQASVFDKHAETLFKLENDPWETTNLIRNSNTKQLLNEMRSVLKRDLIDKRDAHFIHEYSFTKSGKTPFMLSTDSLFYPAEEVINMAFLCGEKDALTSQLEALNHENDIVRYWAAIGIYSHFTLFGNSVEGQMIKLDDPYPPADIFLKATHARYLANKKALKQLINYLKNGYAELGTLSAQLLLLENNYEPEVLEQVIQNCEASKFGAVRQSGELFKHKFLAEKLHYDHFW